MRYLLILFCIILYTTPSLAQNKVNDNGQCYGEWKDSAEWAYDIGQYKIIHKNKYPLDTTKEGYEGEEEGFRYVSFNGYPRDQFYYDPVGDSISVMDGLWQYIASDGKYKSIRSETYYKDGVLLWAKSYDNGLVYYHRVYHNDSITVYNYDDTVLFSKEIRNTDFSIHNTEYYPERPLYISNAEIRSYANYYTNRVDTNIVVLSGKEDVVINSINSSSKQYQLDIPISLPYTIKKGDTVLIKILYQPRRDTPQTKGDITIKTDKSTYQLKIISNAFHIDKETFALDSIVVSKKEDKILHISDYHFPDAEYVLKSSTGKPIQLKLLHMEQQRSFHMAIDIDCHIRLKNIPKGEYIFTISNTDIKKNIRLIVQ